MAFGKFGLYYPDGVAVRPSRFDLVELLRREVAELAANSGSRHRLRFTTSAETCVVDMDRQHLRFVVVNLLQNATKYSEVGSPIDLGVEQLGDDVEIRVKDRGIGVPAADVDALFSPFFRASNVGARPGTGMGLAIAKKSASLIGARLAVRTAAGQGTTVTVVFRRRQGDVPAGH